MSIPKDAPTAAGLGAASSADAATALLTPSSPAPDRHGPVVSPWRDDHEPAPVRLGVEDAEDEDEDYYLDDDDDDEDEVYDDGFFDDEDDDDYDDEDLGDLDEDDEEDD